ncbi:MAG TPA: serine hydrolase domain-containing protein [Yinghuangia sp.]|nr:serine hydrolase domain-containing protein [Yinghuangia sp.]
MSLPATPVSAAAGPLRDTAQLVHDVRAVHDAGALGVLARTDGPYGARAASAGRAELHGTDPVAPHSHFRIGSTTKTFVAVVVLQLAAEGKLSLDDTVDSRLPGVVEGNGNDGRRISIRQLLGHTSGLHDVYADPADFPQTRSASAFRALRFRTYTAAELVGTALRHAPDFAPGTDFGYSNTNYHLAGMIVERVTGNSWQEEVRRRIIGPLALAQTDAPATSEHIRGPHPHAYRTFPDEPEPVDVTEVNPSFAGAAGAMTSTAHDLDRFFTALVAGRLLPPREQAEILRTIPTAGDLNEAWPGSRYGLGIIWIPLPCGGYWSHPGDTFGYSTRGGVTPDARRAYALVVTSEASEATDRAVNDLAANALCT